jgi:hypothetical protein
VPEFYFFHGENKGASDHKKHRNQTSAIPLKNRFGQSGQQQQPDDNVMIDAEFFGPENTEPKNKTGFEP